MSNQTASNEASDIENREPSHVGLSALLGDDGVREAACRLFSSYVDAIPGISMRTANRLCSIFGGTMNIAELVCHSEEHLAGLNGIGKKGIREIVDGLNQVGLKLYPW